MERAEIRSRICGIAKDMMPVWKDHNIDIKDTDNLREDIGLESIDYLDLILQTEIMFDIKIEPDESSRAVTVSDFVSLVESKIK